MKSIFKTTLLASAVFALPGLAQANDELLRLSADPANWAIPSGNYSGTRYSELDQVNKSNVGSLKVAWQFSTGVLRGHEGGPLVIGDVMYVVTPIPNIVFALDLNDEGRIIWKHIPVQGGKYPSGETQARVTSVMCCDNVIRGVSYAGGKIFVGLADSTLQALDAKTGKLVWQAHNMSAGKAGESEATGIKPVRGNAASTNTSVPFVVKDNVFIGCSGAEFGVRCNMTGYNINSGKRAWRAYSMGPDGDILVDPNKTTHMLKPVGKNSSLKTWKGDAWQIGGGSLWGFWAWDPDLDLMYYGTGNPSTWNPVARPGDNRWSMTIMARDPDDGMAKWLYQMTPHDEWDYDGINEMILVDQEVKGKNRKVLVHFDRNGFNYTLDRATGELLVAEKHDPMVNWATHIDMKTGRPALVDKYGTEHGGKGLDYLTKGICPAALGTKDQQPAAYSPRTKLFYIPANHVCMNYEPVHVEYVVGDAYVGANLDMMPGPGGNMGEFVAWDAGKGKVVWEIAEPFSVWSGVLATAGGIVMYGTLEGFVKAVDETSGKLLYKFNSPSGIIGNINTWSHKGKQQIGVYSGVGGWAGYGVAGKLNDVKGNDRAALGAIGGYRHLKNYTQAGGVLTVFELP